MTHFTTKAKRVDGFVAESVKAGEQPKIIIRGSFTSDDPRFYVLASSISNLFLAELKIPTSAIVKFLIIQHEESADIYINDFIELATVQVNRDVQAGEEIYTKDISNITRVNFAGIDIKPTDLLAYCTKINWK